MTNWLITGGNGFLGRHLILKLKENSENKITVLDLTQPREPIEGVTYLWQTVGDITTNDLFWYDYIVHLAAVTDVPFAMKSVKYTFNTNLMDTIHLLETIRVQRNTVQRPAKLILMSSESSYGLAQNIPITEEEPLRPVNPYAASKAAEDIVAQSYIRGFDLPIVIIRSSTMIGEGSRPKQATSIFINQALKGEPITIEGDGSVTKDFNYVGNTAQAIIDAAKSEAKGVYNIGSNKETSMLELAQTIIKLTGSKSEIVYKPWRAGEKGIRCVLSTEKAKRDFGYEPRVTFINGLERHIASVK